MTPQPDSLAGEQEGVRRLLVRDQVLLRLQLSGEKVQGLINTRQLTLIMIAGEERFDSRDIEQLIDTYKTTAARRVI